uniref:TSA: Wollemia nobilis Ref_Wollemi_Transcript_23184_594 transcribed RNA sequence n=1 Tax=Wollemia nobilis TaxID=56998 RepID=A0A0C9S4M9_9CONI
MKRNVGVGVDFSAGSEYALHWALSNLARDGDSIFLIYVNNDVDYGEGALWMEGGAPLVPMEEIGNPILASKYGLKFSAESLERAKMVANHKNLTVALKVYWGDARDKVCRAESDLHLHCLVVGSRGMGTLQRVIIGSVSEYVICNAACPVTVVKTPHHCLE